MSEAQVATRPTPMRDDDSAPFFDSADQDRLAIQHCLACGRNSLADGKYCPQCLGPVEWRESSGSGKVTSYTIVTQVLHPGFAADVPYAVAYIGLEEGPQIVARLVEIDPLRVRVGMPVQVKFLDNPGGARTPVFAPVEAQAPNAVG